MAAKKLRNIITPKNKEAGLRWRTAVPVGTNAFIIMEFLQLSVICCLLAVLSCALGLYLSEGAVYVSDVKEIANLGLMLFAISLAIFLALSFLVMRNRYYAVYRLDESGVYYEVIRGKDENRKPSISQSRPYPVEGEIKGAQIHSRHLIWEKVNSFQNYNMMRTVILKRGFWSMLKIYTPDQETHARLLAYLNARFPHCAEEPLAPIEVNKKGKDEEKTDESKEGSPVDKPGELENKESKPEDQA